MSLSIKTIGIMVDCLNFSQLQASLRNLAAKKVVVYGQNQEFIFDDLGLPILNEVDAFVHDGPMICTTINAIQQALVYPKVGKILYYPWNLEWIYHYAFAKPRLELIMNSRVDIITRSAHHFKIVKNIWKEPIGIVEEFDYDSILRFI